MPGVTVNGESFDHGQLSLEIIAAGQASGTRKEFSDISYEDMVNRTKQRGAERVAYQGTEGEYDANGSVTFYANGYHGLVAWFKDNDLPWYDTEFQLVIRYWSKGEPVHTDTIPHCKFQKRSRTNSQGTEPNKVACELYIEGTIFFDGVDGFGATL